MKTKRGKGEKKKTIPGLTAKDKKEKSTWREEST